MSFEGDIIEVSLDQLREWFEKAFEEGWSNYKENKDSVVMGLLREAKKHKKSPPVTSALMEKWEYFNTWQEQNFVNNVVLTDVNQTPQPALLGIHFNGDPPPEMDLNPPRTIITQT